MNHWQKKELFHVKYYPPNALIFFTRARPGNQIPPHEHATTPNARLNLRRRPARLRRCVRHCLRMFRLHVGDRARLASCFGSSFLNLFKRAGIAQSVGFKTARPNADSFSLKSPPKIPSTTPPGPNHSSFVLIRPPPHSFNFQNPLDIPSLLCYTVLRTNAGVLIAETPSGDFPVSGGEPFT